MRLPVPNAPNRPPGGSTPQFLLGTAALITAGVIVVVTGSTSGFTDLISVLLAVALLGKCRHCDVGPAGSPQ